MQINIEGQNKLYIHTIFADLSNQFINKWLMDLFITSY